MASRRSTGEQAVTLRRATAADECALVLLAQLDSARPLRGDVLVAEVDGRLCAALSLLDGRQIADPFRPSTLVRRLLEVRARRLRDAAAGRSHRVRRLVRALRAEA